MYDAETEAETIVVVIRPFMDDFVVSADGTKTAGAIYYNEPGTPATYRKASQSLRVTGVTTGKTESDALLLAMAQNLVEMKNVGKLMKTVEGIKWVYIKVIALAENWA